MATKKFDELRKGITDDPVRASRLADAESAVAAEYKRYEAGMQQQTYCWSHLEYEDYSDDSLLVCGECMHVFETMDDLIRDFKTEIDEEFKLSSETPIEFCPHCLHDF